MSGAFFVVGSRDGDTKFGIAGGTLVGACVLLGRVDSLELKTRRNQANIRLLNNPPDKNRQ